jgi:hypothetical protein
MDANTKSRIRHIFLSPRPHFPLNTVAELLEMSIDELKAEIKDGAIVAVSTAVGVRVTREEMMAAAMGRWELAVIERALGREASRVLPEAIRLVELRARVPRYQRESCGIWRGRRGRPSAPSCRASWKTWPRRVSRSWRRRCRRSRSRCSLRAGRKADPQITQINADPLILLRNASLFEDRVGGVTRLDSLIDDKVVIRYRTEPDLVIAFSLPLEATAVVAQGSFRSRVNDSDIFRRPASRAPASGW